MTDTTEVLFVGDLHLDKQRKHFPKDHIDLQLDELQKPVHYAKRKGIRDIILGGDLSENPRLSYDAFIGMVRFFARYPDIIFHIILGNHDFAEDGIHSLQQFIALIDLGMLPNVVIHTEPHVEKFGKVKFNFSPYPFTDAVSNAVNVGHFEVSGSTRDNGHKIKKAVDVGERDIWVMGHLHTPHDVGNTHYIGTLFQQNFGERLPKSFTHAYFKMSKGRLKKKYVRVNNDPAFKYFNVEVHSKKDLKVIDKKNPLYLYKLFIHSSFDITEDMLGKFGNVVDIKGFDNKQELKSLMDEEFIELNEQTMALPSVTENLRTFLKEKGADKRQRKRAVEIINDIVKGKANAG